MKRIGQLVSALLVGIVLSASSVQAQQYKYIGKLSFPVGTPEYVARPVGIDIDSDGNIYITDSYDGVTKPQAPTKVFTQSGSYIRSIGRSTFTAGNDGFSNQAGRVKVGSNGLIYIEDFGNAIKLFNKNGDWIRNLVGEGTALGQPYMTRSFAVDSDGSIWNLGRQLVFEFGSPVFRDELQHVSETGEVLSRTLMAYTASPLYRTIANYDLLRTQTGSFFGTGLNLIREFDTAGNIIGTRGNNNYAFPLGDNLAAIRRRSNENLLILDASNNRVIETSYWGAPVGYLDLYTQPDSTNLQVEDIASYKSKVYVTDFATKQVLIWDEANPPVITASVTGTTNTAPWYQTGFSYTSTASDDWTVASQRITVNNTSTDYPGASKELTFTAEGSYTIKVSALDEAGNRSEEKTIQAGVDRTKPSTSATVSNGGLVVTLNATDATSGVKATYYSINGGPVQEYKDLIVVPVGNNPVTYWSVDNAGNREDPKVVTPEGSNNQTSQITSFKIDKSSSLGGPSRSLTLEIKAQSTSTTINIASDNPNVIVPANIIIDAGQTTKTFTIETKPVGGYTQTNITATLGTQTRLAQLDLLPPTAKIAGPV